MLFVGRMPSDTPLDAPFAVVAVGDIHRTSAAAAVVVAAADIPEQPLVPGQNTRQLVHTTLENIAAAAAVESSAALPSYATVAAVELDEHQIHHQRQDILPDTPAGILEQELALLDNMSPRVGASEHQDRPKWGRLREPKPPPANRQLQPCLWGVQTQNRQSQIDHPINLSLKP